MHDLAAVRAETGPAVTHGNGVCAGSAAKQVAAEQMAAGQMAAEQMVEDTEEPMKPGHTGDRNVLFVAYEFPPRGESGVQRSAKFAKYLPQFGYRPLVLTAAEREADATGLKIDRSLAEDVRNTEIFPCRGSEHFLMRLPDRIEPLRRVLKFCLRPDRNVLAWLPRAKRTALKIARQRRIDVIYTSVSPFSSGLLGRKLKRLLGVPWVVDFRDPWADNLMGFWPTRLHYRIEAAQEYRVVEAADAVVVVTPTMKDLMVRRYPQWADKVHVICNGFDAEDFWRCNGRPPSGKLQIAHTGRMVDHDRKTVRGSWGPLSRFWFSRIAFRHAFVDFTTHSPYYLLHAVRQLLDERPQLQDKITLAFAGTFGRSNLELVRQLNLENVVSDKGYLPHAQSVQLLMDSDVLFLPLMRSTDGRRSYIYTGKIFEYLATGKPILAAVPDGDARDLIQRARAGWCVDPRDIGAIKALLADLVERKTAQSLTVNPDQQVIAQYERRKLTGQLATLFDSLI